MIKGMYSSASGMIPRIKKQEVIANNLANAGSAGFKKDQLFVRELSKAEQKIIPKKSDWQKPIGDTTYTDFTPGTFDRTDNPLDLALDGDGFFRLQGPDGNTYLTRTGSFMVNSDGFLTYPGGYLLMGEGSPIQVGDGTVNVATTGEVQVNGTTVSRIVPMTTADLTKLSKVGHSLFSVPQSAPLSAAPNPSVQQGYLETANVDAVKEMVDMIATYRIYEANAKAMQQQDSSLDQLFNKVNG
jgi:flagellar basal-body rod protein FlgF